MKQYYEVKGWSKFGEEDVYKEGCIPSTSFGDSGNDTFTGQTIKACIKECQDFCGSDSKDDLLLDACDEQGKLDISIMENEEGYPASEHEIKLWKKQKIKLFNCIYSFKIRLITTQEISLTAE